MSGISVSTGLISGLDFEALANSLISRRQSEIDRLGARVTLFDAKKTGISILEANLLTLSASASSLSSESTYQNLSVSNPDSDTLKVTTDSGAVTGTYKFQAVRKAAAHQAVSKGYANTEQKPGTGTLVISRGGELNQKTLLETLNDGSGVRRGSIRISDRAGSQAVIDLSSALSVDDVITKINENVDVAVTASTSNGSIVLTDTSGSTSTSLSVIDLNGGKTAEDLGINKSVASSSFQGDSVYEIQSGFTLEQINDGNGLNRVTGAPDLKITLTDATELEINLDDAVTLNDVVQAINSHDDNGGKLTATITSGRLVLTDSAAGGGTLTAEDLNGSTVLRPLGLDATASGNVLTGNRLGAGLNSVLLRNLNGGSGISEKGSIAITNRAGLTATIDLSNVDSLDEVISAINTAVDDGSSTAMQLTASINKTGTGIVIEDKTGSTASNLVIADVATGTVAADLGITLDAAQTTIDSGSLNLRYVNESTSLENYSPDGTPVSTGEFQITDTDGNVGIISLTSSVKTVGDIITRINANSSISVTAALNETGDGFVLIDEAGGAGTLKVEEFSGGSTAADLRLLGDSVTGTDSKQRVSSRIATVIEIEEEDTITSIVEKINAFGGLAGASIFDDGSQFNSTRLSLSSSTTGSAGRLVIDDGGLNLDFGTVIQGEDAVLKLGDDPSSAFLLVSSSNLFQDVVTGVDVEILDTSSTISEVVLQKDTAGIKTGIQSLVSGFNQLITTAGSLSKFDAGTNESGILQGETFVLRMLSRLDRTITARNGDIDAKVRSMSDLGVRIGKEGKLTIDQAKLSDALLNNPDAVEKFFIDANNGIAEKIKGTLDSFTNVTDGSFAIEKRTIDTSIAGIDQRIEDLTVLMESKRSRILLQFIKMESAIGQLQSQQTALAAFTPLKPRTSS